MDQPGSQPHSWPARAIQPACSREVWEGPSPSEESWLADRKQHQGPRAQVRLNRSEAYRDSFLSDKKRSAYMINPVNAACQGKVRQRSECRPVDSEGVEAIACADQ